jgi:hypothetical protein
MIPYQSASANARLSPLVLLLIAHRRSSLLHQGWWLKEEMPRKTFAKFSPFNRASYAGPTARHCRFVL